MMKVTLLHKLRRSLLCVCLMVGALPFIHAQLIAPITPTESTSKLRTTELSEISLLPPSQAIIDSMVSVELSAQLRDGYRIAVPVSTDISVLEKGVWHHDHKGNRVCELALSIKGAKSLQLYFDRFYIPQGGRLFILSPEGELLKGAFTEINNTHLQALPIAPIAGDRVVIRYEASSNTTEEPLLHLASVGYGFRTFDAHPGDSKYETGEPWMRGTYSCAPNIVSLPKLDEVKRSLVLMMVRGSMICSGVLINNMTKDGTAYILTASHCVNASFRRAGNKNYIQESARQSVFFFNFYSPIGDKLIRGVEEHTLAGAEVVALDERRDLCLLRIVGVESEGKTPSGGIPAVYQPYYAGWNANANPKGPFYGIHHPTASVARYSLCRDASLDIDEFDAGQMHWYDSHYHIKKWQIGTTAGGSSGSPLLDQNLQIVGALTGGSSTCNEPKDDFYYSVERCWTGNGVDSIYLKPYLDPNGTGNRQCDGFDPYTPLTTKILSNHRYAPWRDSVEFVAPPTEYDGLLTTYRVREKSMLSGLIILAEMTRSASQEMQLVAYKEAANGTKEELYRADFTLPSFQRFVGGGTSTEEVGRTLIGPIAAYIPFGREIEIAKDQILYVGLESKVGKPLSFVPCRTKPSAQIGGATLYKRIGESDYHESSPYKGYYWIDALIRPLEQAADTLSPTLTMPQAYIFGASLRLVLPKGAAESATVAIYSLHGEKLFTYTTQDEVSDVALPNITHGAWRVLYVSYRKENYGMVVYIGQ